LTGSQVHERIEPENREDGMRQGLIRKFNQAIKDHERIGRNCYLRLKILGPESYSDPIRVIGFKSKRDENGISRYFAKALGSGEWIDFEQGYLKDEIYFN